MKNTLLAISLLTTAATGPLCARELLCEQCVPEPECWEHLFVERCQWFAHGEFLYWGVAAGNLDYAVIQSKPSALFLSGNLGNYQTADYDFCPGFRVAASYYNCPKYWEVTAQYTWFHDSGKNSICSSLECDSLLTPSRATVSVGPFTKASSRIELDYQLGDLYAARVFDPNPHLRMRVYGGITAGWLEQDWNISYTGSMDQKETIEENWRFSGGGIRAGLSADWFWGCQIYLTGRVSFATLFGSYKNRELQKLDANRIVSCATYDDYRFAFNTQFMLGPSWQIPCDCWSFELFAGYESNLWFNVHERIRSSRELIEDSRETFYAQSAFGFHGLTLRLTLGF